jgi:tetratricopeptide (TPR) repeat protein
LRRRTRSRRPDHSDSVHELEVVLDEWRTELSQGIAARADNAEHLIEQAFAHAESDGVGTRVRASLDALLDQHRAVGTRLAGLLETAEAVHEEWVAERRYTEQGLEALDAKLTADEDPVRAARRWLDEIVNAVRVGEWSAVAHLAALALSFPDELRPGADDVRLRLADWLLGDHETGYELWQAIGKGEIPGWDRVLDPAIRSRALRLAAWLALRVLDDPERARNALDAAIELDPYSGPSHAERAAYFLYAGDLDRASVDAQRAIELTPEDPAGYLQLGTWAELSGQFDEARSLYRRGLSLMPLYWLATQSKRTSLLDPPGAMLVVAAELLLDARRAEAALAAAQGALMEGVRGAEQHADAAVHRLRSGALEQLDRRAEAAEAALEAGKREVWNDNLGAAIPSLERAIALGIETGDAGWVLADAISASSFPPEASQPDQVVISRAIREWESWTGKVGHPSGMAAWAYLTRGTLAELEGFGKGKGGYWQALHYAERALVHSPNDGQGWGMAAKYLRAIQAEELALEAADRGAALPEPNQMVLAERMALLANRGRLDDAESTAATLVTTYGDDPWTSGVRGWVAFKQGRVEDALAFLEAPLAGQYDLAWYYELEAMCHVEAGDLEAAREAYDKLRTKANPITPGTKIALAVACTALGRLEEAADWLTQAKEDETTSKGTVLGGAAFHALASDELERGERLLREALEASRNTFELTDALEEALVRLHALGDDDDSRRCQVVLGLKRDALPALLEAFTAPTADAELAELIAKNAPSQGAARHDAVASTLLAIEARRKADAGDLIGAAEGYDGLRGGAFEPEATIALNRLLHRVSDEGVAAGDVEAVLRACEWLERADPESAGPVDTALAAADALVVAGRPNEARTQLLGAMPAAADDVELEALHRRLGELAFAADDTGAATEELAAALELATKRGDTLHVARLEARLCLATLSDGDAGKATQHARAALAALRTAGAFEPGSTLIDELRGVLGRGVAPQSKERTLGALRRVLEELRAEGTTITDTQLGELTTAESSSEDRVTPA